MILERIPFQRQHLDQLNEDGLAEGVSADVGADAGPLLEASNSWTVTHGGRPVFCGGTIQLWPGRHMAWAGVSSEAGPYMKFITREARWIVEQADGRVELTVRADFESGHRWARMLGFDVENPPGLLRRYGVDGEDHVAYVRLNGS